MKKPTRPRKPTKPIEPPKKIPNPPKIKYFYSNDITISELLKIIDGADYDKTKLVINQYWDDADIYLEIPNDPPEIDNPYYKAQYKEYQTKLKRFQKKSAEYDIKYLKYEDDMAKYLRWIKEKEEKEELAQLEQLKKKYEKC